MEKDKKVNKAATRQTCPRCKSKRLGLNGYRFCRRCGQRWRSDGTIVPSYDRRNRS